MLVRLTMTDDVLHRDSVHPTPLRTLPDNLVDLCLVPRDEVRMTSDAETQGLLVKAPHMSSNLGVLSTSFADTVLSNHPVITD